jgi:hypothetical protein
LIKALSWETSRIGAFFMSTVVVGVLVVCSGADGADRGGEVLVETLYVYYDHTVEAREYVWTDAGKARAVSNGVSLSEVSDALHAPKGLYYERQVGDLLLIVMGMAETGRVIAVVCDRIEESQIYTIINAHPLGGTDLDQWREHV